MKILIVDDNSEMRRLIKSLITDLTDDIYECADGTEAFEIYSKHYPDWILMDVFMKHTDGLKATKIIKEYDREAKIVIVSNHTDKRTRQAAAEAGAVKFFGKDDLLSLVSYLENNRH